MDDHDSYCDDYEDYQQNLISELRARVRELTGTIAEIRDYAHSHRHDNSRLAVAPHGLNAVAYRIWDMAKDALDKRVDL